MRRSGRSISRADDRRHAGQGPGGSIAVSRSEPVFHREGEIACADRFLAEVPDLEIVGESPFEGTVSLRWVLVHMIEEYGRPVGHADLLRERIDGQWASSPTGSG